MIASAKSKTKRDLPSRMMEAFDLYSPEIDANPFPYYEILREQYPCYWSESGKLWILSRYDDIVQATRDKCNGISHLAGCVYRCVRKKFSY